LARLITLFSALELAQHFIKMMALQFLFGRAQQLQPP
jgi:hypothetical protein